jgi:hypothetical protein
LSLISLTSLLVAAPAADALTLDYGQHLRQVAQVGTDAALAGVARVGPYALVSGRQVNGQVVLQVFSVADPGAPALVQTVPVECEAAGPVLVGGNYAYMPWTTGQPFPFAGLAVFDITNPAAPQPLLEWGPDPGEHAVLSGNLLVGTQTGEWGGGTLLIVDVTDPTQPQLRSACPLGTLGFPRGVAVSGSIAYVSSESDGLVLVNLANPSNPSVIGIRPLGAVPGPLASDGAWAFVTSSTGGYPPYHLLSVDLADPLNPAVGAQLPIGDMGDVVVYGARAYVGCQANSDWMRGFTVVDIADPAAPQNLGRFGGNYSACDLAPTATHLVEANESGVLRVLALESGSPAAPAALIGSPWDQFVEHASAHGSLGFFGGQSPPTYVVDAADPAHPVLVASWRFLCQKMAFAGDLAFALDWPRLRVLNIQSPAAPSILATVQLSQPVDLTVSGTYLFVADRAAGLAVVDVSNPSSPFLAATLATVGSAEGIAIQGSRAYLAASGSFCVVDLSDPEHPQLLASVPAGQNARDVVVDGGYAFVVEAWDGLLVYDIADPVHPFLVATLPMPHADTYHLDLHENVLYVANDYGGTVLVDVSDPEAPRYRGNLAPAIAGRTYDVAIGTTCAFLADGSGGISMAWLDASTTSATPEIPVPDRLSIRVVPNPGTESSAVEWESRTAARATVEIFDCAGARVARLADQEFPAGRHRLAWDGRDRSGRPVPAGAYLVRVKTGSGEPATSRMVRLR